jgi:hypothetical protein
MQSKAQHLQQLLLQCQAVSTCIQDSSLIRVQAAFCPWQQLHQGPQL